MKQRSVTPEQPKPRPDPGRMRIFLDGFIYAGSRVDITTERNSATLYLAASESGVELAVDGQWSRCAAAIISPRTPRRLRACDEPFVCIDLCAYHPHYRQFSQAVVNGLLPLPHAHFAPLMGALNDFHSGAMPLAQTGKLYRQAVALAAQLLPAPHPLDPRVAQVMGLLRDDRHRALDELAREVGLSNDWLSHLFQRETGMSLRKYVQTLKVYAAVGFVGSHLSVTQIAQEAGFSDAAHFTKVWKSCFGVSPNWVFSGERLVLDVVPWQTSYRADIEAGRLAL
jgi:AraC family transcriptional regulator, arabinose operon regulatory protein